MVLDTHICPEEMKVSHFLATSESHGKFKQEVRSGGAFKIEAVRISADAFEETTPAVADFTIGMGLSKNVPSDWNYGDGWAGQKTSQPGSSLITPAGTSVDHRVHSSNEILVVACPDEILAALLYEHDIASTSVFDRLLRDVFIDDTKLRVLVQTLWKESAKGTPWSGLMIDALWQSIVARLLQLANAPVEMKSYGLTHRQIVQIDEYIDANLSTAFNTKDLAALVGLPLSQFSKDFRDATGCSPYQYVLSKRLERAQHELAASATPLAVVALRCGFSSQSHLTDVFREKLGSTPGRFRRDLLN